MRSAPEGVLCDSRSSSCRRLPALSNRCRPLPATVGAMTRGSSSTSPSANIDCASPMLPWTPMSPPGQGLELADEFPHGAGDHGRPVPGDVRLLGGHDVVIAAGHLDEPMGAAVQGDGRNVSSMRTQAEPCRPPQGRSSTSPWRGISSPGGLQPGLVGRHDGVHAVTQAKLPDDARLRERASNPGVGAPAHVIGRRRPVCAAESPPARTPARIGRHSHK